MRKGGRRCAILLLLVPLWAVFLPIMQGGGGAQWRAGYGFSARDGQAIGDWPAAADLGAGWYYDWYVRVEPPRPGGIEYVQMVNVTAAGPVQPVAVIEEAARANPGSTWLLGNEVEVRELGGMGAEQYAVVYHDLRAVIKGADATAVVATGSVAQFTRLERGYLERLLREYRRRYGGPMPVDVWNIHGYILDWERHTDVPEFAQRLMDFRAWLDSHGYAGVPVIVSEFGVLWETPEEEAVRFLGETVAWMQAHPGHVQRWAWAALNEVPPWEVAALAVRGGGLTATGQAFAGLVKAN